MRPSLALIVFLSACGGPAVEAVHEPIDRPEPPPIGLDTDNDGLPDAWETWAADPSRLNAMLADTDGDGTPDGDEDDDGDGLTNRQEFALSRLDPEPAAIPPHPFVKSVLVELDAMEGWALDAMVIERAAAAYDHVDLGIHFFRDEEHVDPQTFDGSFEQRWAVFEGNGPRFEGSALDDIPVNRMIHMVVAKSRSDIAGRGGEVVTHGDGDVAKTGVFIYAETLDSIHPACGGAEGGPIRLEDALTGTVIHELGHALQLGHDTDRGGGVNFYNVMAVASSCHEALMRFEGVGNDDPTLGSTSIEKEPRFSDAARRLIDLNQIISVDTSTLFDDTGHEM